MELSVDYRIYKSYRVEGKIGKGVYGQVYKVVQKNSEKAFAIKKIFDAFQNLTDAKRTYRELAYLLQLSHPCIIKLQKVIVDEQEEPIAKNQPKNVYAVFELMQIDLSKTLQITKLQILQRKYISMQILSGLQYLHSSQLIHRDIKPSNILLTQSCDAKLCDFGLVRLANQFYSHHSKKNKQIFTEYVASKWYRAPQIMLCGNQVSTYSIDMWSAGCVMAEMCLGTPLFKGNNTLQQLQNIFMVIGMPLEQEIQQITSEDGKFLLKNFRKLKRTHLRQVLSETATVQQIDLIQQLLTFDPNKRMTAKQAINHVYFDEISDLKSKFKVQPVKILDNSIKQKQVSLNLYKYLIQSLCVNTKRGSTSRSRQNIKQNKYETKQLTRYQSTKQQQGMQQKSTRESNSGQLKRYKIDRRQKYEQSRQKNIQDKNNITRFNNKNRSKSKQSNNSGSNKRGNSNKSKIKMYQNKYGNKIKPIKSESNMRFKGQQSVKKGKKKINNSKF